MNDAERVTLKEYVDRVFDEKEKALNLAFKSQQDALALATRALDRELEHLNDLRQEVTNARGWVIGFGTAGGLFAGVVGALVVRSIGT